MEMGGGLGHRVLDQEELWKVPRPSTLFHERANGFLHREMMKVT